MNIGHRVQINSNPARMPSRGRLILFGRYPEPGRTKTRLIPALGPVGAADLQRRLTAESMATALQAGLPPACVEFCSTGGTPSRIRAWLGHCGIGFNRQTGADLGSRMHNALCDAISRGGGPAVLVGTDIPAMTAEHLREAFQALDDHDLVLGPSRDGGYWLIGLNRPLNLFESMPWGHPDVLARTLAEARRQGLRVALLETLNDIDTEADLSAWRHRDGWRKPYISVVIPALNEAGVIAAAIRRARSADSEIIVADGGSRDDTVVRARSAGAAVIVTPTGRAIQQNRAAQQASGRVLLFLHADAALPQNFASHVFEALMPRTVSAGAFRFKTDYAHWGMRLIEKTVHLRSTLFQMPYGDQALFMSKTLFERAGGFPEVPIAEDLYLVRRLRRMGRIAQTRTAVVTSGRRWRRLGVARTTLVNYLIAGGCLLGIDPRRLAPIYRLGVGQK